MDMLSEVSSDQVLGEWLKHEYRIREDIRKDASSYLAKLGQDESVVISPDYDNQEENEVRKTLWLQTPRGVIVTWVPSFSWKTVRLTESEINHLETFQANDWEIRTRGTFEFSKLVEVLASNEGRTYLSSVDQQWVSDIESWKNETRRIGLTGPLVIIREGDVIRLVEGYHRLAAALVLRIQGSKIQIPFFYLGEQIR